MIERLVAKHYRIVREAGSGGGRRQSESVSDAVAKLSSALTGRYRIERDLGAGGMATLYLAHDP